MSKPLSDENLSMLFRQKLHEESQRWAEENLLSPEQRDAILQRYATPPTVALAESAPTEVVKEFPLFIRVVLALAVFLVGLAVLLLVSFNWAYLPGTAKLTIVGSVLAAAHAGGYYLRKTGWKNWADGALFFAGIMYGVGIWQIGQVFHLPADFPMGLWLWAFGVFFLALVLRSSSLHALTAAILAAWVISLMTGFFDPLKMFWLELIPFTAWSLLLFAGVGIATCILTQKRRAATLYTILIGFWWILQGINCALGPFLTFHIAAVGLICIALSSLQFKSIGNVALGRVGAFLILGGLFAPSFLNYWAGGLLSPGDWQNPNIVKHYSLYQFWAIALPVINFLILVALFVLRDHRNCLLLIQRNVVIVTSAVSIFVLWLGSCLISMTGTPSGNRYHQPFFLDLLFFGPPRGGWYIRHVDDPLAYAGMFTVNALILVLTIWLIVTGLKRNIGGWFWSGVFFFLFWAIVRYIDMFSDFGGMLGAATIFLLCGLFMFGIVYFWATQRHKFRITEPAAASPPEFTAPLWWIAMGNKLSILWQSERNVLTSVFIVALLQFGILGAMIANEMRPHIAATTGTGTTIRVATVPVDPRDLFRGDYVVLRYEFSNARSVGFYDSLTSEQTVFVTMKQDGELWKATGSSRTRPKDGIFLRGIAKPNGVIEYGIESYFVQEGTGYAIERAMARVVVELVVAPDGKASIKAVQVL